MQIMVNTFDRRIILLVHGFLLILTHFLMWKKKKAVKNWSVCSFYILLHFAQNYIHFVVQICHRALSDKMFICSQKQESIMHLIMCGMYTIPL